MKPRSPGTETGAGGQGIPENSGLHVLDPSFARISSSGDAIASGRPGVQPKGRCNRPPWLRRSLFGQHPCRRTKRRAAECFLRRPQDGSVVLPT